MKPISILILLSNLLTWNTSQGQQVYFNNRYDLFNSWEVAWNVIELDSTYLIVGGADNGGNSIGILFVDKQGNQTLERSFNHPAGSDFPGLSGSLIQTTDGGFALGGSINISGVSNVMLWRFDENMDTLWTKIYGDTPNDQIGYQCKQTPDGGFIIIGVTNASGNDDILLIKTDSLGNKEWDTIYGGGGDESGIALDLTIDSGYVLGGFTRSFGAGGADMYVVKVDSLGGQQWDTTFGGIYDDGVGVIKQTVDGGYLIGGAYGQFILSGSFTQRQPYIIKLNNQGIVEWERGYGPARLVASLTSIHEQTDGSFVAAGQAANRAGTPNGNGFEEGIVLKVGSQGDSLWYRVYEYVPCDQSSDFLRDIKPTSDGGFISVGGITAPIACGDTGTQDIWVLKLDSCGCAYVGCDSACQQLVGIDDLQFTNPKLTLKIYPNPAGSMATVSIPYSGEGTKPSFANASVGKNYQLSIYDITGRELKSYAMHNQPDITINTKELGSGLYFLRLTALGGRHDGRMLGSGKLVVE